MEIKLGHDEIVQAIKDYIGTQGISVGTQEIGVELTAGRGGKGHYADITIGGVPAKKLKPAAKPKAVTAKASAGDGKKTAEPIANKYVVEENAVEESSNVVEEDAADNDNKVEESTADNEVEESGGGGLFDD